MYITYPYADMLKTSRDYRVAIKLGTTQLSNYNSTHPISSATPHPVTTIASIPAHSIEPLISAATPGLEVALVAAPEVVPLEAAFTGPRTPPCALAGVVALLTPAAADLNIARV